METEKDTEKEKRTVLYVDDSQLMRSLMVQTFGCGILDSVSDRGYEIVTAEDGLAALCRIAAQPIDVVVLDMNMPKLNGYQFLGILNGTYRMLRRDETEKIEEMEKKHDAVRRALNGDYKEIPVIVLSADGLTNEERIKKLGAYEIICKPYMGDARTALENAIERALRQNKPIGTA